MRYLRRLAEADERWADRPFLVDGPGDRTVTHREARATAAALASELRHRGLERGDRMALAAPNAVELALLYMAAAYAGVVVVPIGSGFGRRELSSILDRARPRLVVADDGAAKLRELAGEREIDTIALGEAGLDPWAAEDAGDGWQPFDGASSADLASIHFTSGTTGPPRGVGHTFGDFVGNALRFADAAGLDESNTFHSALPMTYMAGYYNLLLLPLTIGASVVVDHAFGPRSLMSFWDVPARHGADVLWLVPTMMAMLLQLDRGDAGADYCREAVRFAAVGTAPLDAELRQRFEDRYGVTVHNSYGLSETLLATASTPAQPADGDAVGAPLPGVEVAVLSDTGTPLEPGEAGVVGIVSPDTMLGYLTEADANGRLRFDPPPALGGGWFDTGDIGTLDPGGTLRITGRTKEVIIRGGVNLSPLEIERVLSAEPLVENVAVVGTPHPLLGEELTAVIVPAPSATLELAEAALRERAASQLEEPQRPGVYLEIDALPRTPTGKVRRGTVRDLAIDRLGLPASAKGFTADAHRDEGASAGSKPRIIDLSHPVHEGMTTFPSPNHPRVGDDPARPPSRGGPRDSPGRDRDAHGHAPRCPAAFHRGWRRNGLARAGRSRRTGSDR